MENKALREEYQVAARLLEEDGFAPENSFWGVLDSYAALLRKWNPFASLVSLGDAPHIESTHVVDALSLVAHVARACASPEKSLLDIGSGGGFPAIPIKLALPRLSLVMIERSAKKVGFLRKAAGALGLEGVEIRHGEFPRAAEGLRPGAITARAVEKPQRLVPQILRFLEEPGKEGVFLCQSGMPDLAPTETFHVEHCQDRWDKAGLRRGTLHLVHPR